MTRDHRLKRIPNYNNLRSQTSNLKRRDNMHEISDTAAYIHTLPEVAVDRLPQRERRRAACVKLF